MSSPTLDSKRPYGQVSSEDLHDDKKQHTKVGRKLIETQPKSKRTAQNRAAQRAYRERKERKMKDLEDKVTSLEDEKLRANNEHNILRAQIERLKAELSRYRGSNDFSDIGVAPVENKPASDLVVGQPWSKTPAHSWDETSQPSSVTLPDLMSGSSSSTSPLNENVIVSPVSNSSDQDHYTKPQRDVGLFEEDLDPFCMKLGEACGTKSKPVPKFKRDSEVYPKQHKSSFGSNQVSVDSPLHALFTPNMTLSDPYFSNLEEPTFNFSFDQSNTADPSIFLNDANFDVSLALGDNTPYDSGVKQEPTEHLSSLLKPQQDPLAGLVNEESVYDPLNSVDTNFNFNEFVKSSLNSNSSRHTSVDGAKTFSSMTSFDSPAAVPEETDKEVVPAPESTLKCAEIWERISTHPKYTDLDIDGLCSELKSKAKCSERGVVLNASDVHSILEQSALNR